MRAIVAILLILATSNASATESQLLRTTGDVLAITDIVLAQAASETQGLIVSDSLASGISDQGEAQRTWRLIRSTKSECENTPDPRRDSTLPTISFVDSYSDRDVQAARARMGSSRLTDRLARAQEEGRTQCRPQSVAKLLGWNRFRIFSSNTNSKLYDVDFASAADSVIDQIKTKCKIEVPRETVLKDLAIYRWKKNPSLKASDLVWFRDTLSTNSRLSLADELARAASVRTGRPTALVHTDELVSLLKAMAKPGETVSRVTSNQDTSVRENESLVIFKTGEGSEDTDTYAVFSIGDGQKLQTDSSLTTLAEPDLSITKEFIRLREGRSSQIVPPVQALCDGRACEVRVGTNGEARDFTFGVVPPSSLIPSSQSPSTRAPNLPIAQLGIDSSGTSRAIVLDSSASENRAAQPNREALPGVMDMGGFDLANLRPRAETAPVRATVDDQRIPKNMAEMSEIFEPKQARRDLEVRIENDPTAYDIAQVMAAGGKKIKKRTWAVKYENPDILGPNIFLAAGRPPGANRKPGVFIGYQVRGICTIWLCTDP